MIVPSKLKNGDEIRVISPARSMGIIKDPFRDIAKSVFKKMGLNISFSKNVEEIDDFNSSSIESRIEDLHEAFSDRNVKGIITTIGGFNSNQLLRYIDYDLIKRNPKVLCGYSDITALHSAILKKTGMVAYYGPHFSSFSMEKGIEYTIEYFKKCLMKEEPFEINPSDEWSDDRWYESKDKRTFIKNNGFVIMQEGEAKGTVIGGNLCTLNLLQGTEFMPSIKNSVLFIEDDHESKPHHFDRDIQSLIHQPDFESVKGLVIGRFQKESNMTDSMLEKIIKSKKELRGIPIISNADFGHTFPITTFPLGGKVEIHAYDENCKIVVVEH